jgi:hypothetical protein
MRQRKKRVHQPTKTTSQPKKIPIRSKRNPPTRFSPRSHWPKLNSRISRIPSKKVKRMLKRGTRRRLKKQLKRSRKRPTKRKARKRRLRKRPRQTRRRESPRQPRSQRSTMLRSWLRSPK